MKITILATITVCLLAVAFDTVPARAQGEDKNQNEALTSLQIKKLNLEIKDLEDKGTIWSTLILQVIPPLTTLIAVAGLMFTIYKDRIDRKHLLVTRDEDHIREDVDQLLTLDPEKAQSIGKISFLLDDLNNLVNRNPVRRQAITTSIVEFIHNDCDFDKTSHINLDYEAISKWEDYRKYLISRQDMNTFLIYKYAQAFRRLHSEDSGYFETLKWGGSGYIVEEYTVESRYLRYLALADGFMEHLKLVKDANVKKKAIQDFKLALNNPTLTVQLFGTDAS